LFSAIALTEAWLTPQSQDMFIIDGYNFVVDSRSDRIGGEVGIFINSDYVFRLRSDLSRMNDFIECVFVEIGEEGAQHFIIGCVYRPLNSNVAKFIQEIVFILATINRGSQKLTFLAGDYNLDLIKSDSHDPTEEFVNLKMNTGVSFSLVSTNYKFSCQNNHHNSFVD